MSIIGRWGLASGLAVAAATLGGCVDDHGYGGVQVGYASGYVGDYDGWYDGYYGDGYADGGYGYPGYYGWYGGYYYPGNGLYVYDRYRRPYRWNDDQRRYWGGQHEAHRGGYDHRPGTNWGGFDRARDMGTQRPAGQAFRGYHGARTEGGRGGGRHR